MKKVVKCIAGLLVLTLMSSCYSSLKVLNSWTESENNDLSRKNVLVIAKTSNNSVRIETEEAITKQLAASNIKATSSFDLFSMLDPDRKLSKEEVEDFEKKIKNKGFNAIVLTTLKDYDETQHTEESGGYYAGGNYYGGYYGGFNSYYGTIYPIYFDSGVYVPSETNTYISKKYVLETVTYNLDLPKNKELISVTTVQVEDPANLSSITKKYAKAVVSRILKPQ